MGVDVKISLPLHVKGEYLLLVLAKLADLPLEKVSIGDKEADLNLACSMDNTWCLWSSEDDISFKMESKISPDCGTIIYRNAFDRRSLFYHRITEDEDRQLLSARSNPWNLALGERLVRFFGGSFIANDCSEKVDLRISNKKALFPRRVSTQDNNDRFYQFYNQLDQLPPISAFEVIKAFGQASYTDNKELLQWEGLHQSQLAQANRNELEDHTPAVLNANRRPRRPGL